MYLTGFADEAADTIEQQINAMKTLGWQYIESRHIAGHNLTMMPESQFESVCEALDHAGIGVNCFGSGVANWSQQITDPPDHSYNELKNAIPRMHKLNCSLIRVMSFACPEDDSINAPEIADEVIRRMRILTKMAEDGGITLVHENCDNWGGRSFEHSLRLIDAVQSPNFRLVFDTGNPVFRKDIRGNPPYSYQSAWTFYTQVKDFIAYVHVKDAVIENDRPRFTFPGDGDGEVVRILTDLHRSGYDGGISIEPHLAVVHHDDTIQSDDEIRFNNFIEYGRRLENILAGIGWTATATT